MPHKKKYSKHIIYLINFVVFICLPIQLLSSETQFTEKQVPRIDHAIQSGKLNQWIIDSKNEMKRAKQILNQFDKQAVYTKKGKLRAHTMPDGTREEYRYNSQRFLVSVWVTSSDKKFIEERVYYKKKLKSIMYTDGTMKTLHYPDWESQARPEVIDVFSHSSGQVRLFRYSGQGHLIAAYIENGSEIPKGNLTDFQQLSSLIDPALIQLGAE